MLKNHKLGWPAVVLALGVLGAFVALYVLAPDDRDTIEKAVLAVWAFVATFLAPLLRKKFDHEHDDERTDPS